MNDVHSLPTVWFCATRHLLTDDNVQYEYRVNSSNVTIAGT